MKYKKFKIHKYKAIENVEISLRNNLIPIIGINESGKTSILYAILSFDQDNDDYFNGNHLVAENRYEWDSKNHEISAEIEFNNEGEIESIIEDLKITKRNKLYRDLLELFQNGNRIIVKRNLDIREYSITNLVIDNELEKILITEIFKRTPFILFFDDFTDRVPTSIKFPPNYSDLSYIESSDTDRSDWHIYIEEIIYRATNKEKTLSDLLNTDEKIRKGILSDVTDKLNEDIIKEWKQLKILQRQLVDDKINDLSIELDYEKNEIGFHVFKFSVIDKNFKGKSRYFTIQERSKGFQWFFNYAIKLKYNSKYYSDFEGAIYLLDEPGSYLHSSAQEELLESLEKISQTNKIIYCTHSQYLLNPETINIGNIKIAKRNNGKISLQNYGEYTDSKNEAGALSPLYDALHLSLGKHHYPRDENILITEGITDYYFFRMLQNSSKFNFISDLVIIPGASANNLKELISFAISWSKRYVVIFDSDDAGNTAFIQYQTFFGENQSDNWLKYQTVTDQNKVLLEKLISKEDQEKLKSTVSCQSVKKSITALFYSNDEIKSNWINNLDSCTTANILKNIDSIMTVLNR
jgi:predicted ATP-dependent endonuclease of OLD family